jgi:hypothetical protein
VVSLTPLPLYTRGNSPPVPIVQPVLGGPQSHFRRYGEDKNPLLLLGIEPQFLVLPTHDLVAVVLNI